MGSVAGYGGHIVGYLLGTLAGSVQTSHVAIDLRIVDTRTSRVLAATSVQAKATDIAGLGALAGPELGVGLSGYARTPMEKAVRIAIQEAVRFVVSKTPAQYYRYTDTGQMAGSPAPVPPVQQAAPPTPPGGPVSSLTSAESPAQVAAVRPAASPPPASETTVIVFVKTQFVNMRAEPNVSAKVLAVLKKGMKLTLLDEKAQWYRVKLEDGSEGWVAASVTSLHPE